MIRIHKNLANVPASLSNTTTQNHWNSVISSAAWQDSSRYKEADTKQALKEIYDNKCVFCEKSQLDTFPQVEHFRPKKIYYWLGFSWDNLLWACAKCNLPKSAKFDVLGTRVSYAGETFADIHTLSAHYDATEQPEFFNPETADPEPHLVFSSSGIISSAHSQINYTIINCELNRDELVESRMAIFNDELKNRLERKLWNANLNNTNFREKQANVRTEIFDIIEPFCKEIIENNAFRAWRKYIIRHCAKFLTFGNNIFDTLIRLVVEEKIRRNPDYNDIFR
jgi:uncharacterized protein (TIGR02646 family)